MTVADQRNVPANPGTVPPVPPSLPVRIVLRPLSKRLNPLILRLAGGRRFGLAQLRHVGRRSGRTYVTAVSPRRSGDVVLIALTFGNQSDWAKNVAAAGACSLRMDGVEYNASAPAFLSRSEAAPLVRSAFSPLERFSLRLLGIKQFLRLDVVPAPR